MLHFELTDSVNVHVKNGDQLIIEEISNANSSAAGNGFYIDHLTESNTPTLSQIKPTQTLLETNNPQQSSSSHSQDFVVVREMKDDNSYEKELNR